MNTARKGIPFALLAIGGVIYFVLQKQINQLQDDNRRYKSLATTDPLTGVGNLRSMNERIEEEVSRSDRSGSPFVFALVDLDEFGLVNSAVGHGNANLVLAHTANVVKEETRKIDRVSRFGGDEFAVIMPGLNAEQSVPVFARIIRKLSETNPFPDQINLGVSIGITEYPNDHFSSDYPHNYGILISDMVSQASEALYIAKKDPARISIYNS